MAVATLPKKSVSLVTACLIAETLALTAVMTHRDRSVWLFAIAFFLSGFIADLISGLAHFGFDYIWPPTIPILGPIAVEFRQHHETPTLDPSNFVENFSRGAYVALPLALITYWSAVRWSPTSGSFFLLSLMAEASVWAFAFHQIHSYAHMGASLSPDEFNAMVAMAAQMPSQQQEAEFEKIFAAKGIPLIVRMLQRSGIFLRPQKHWRHHIGFECDFSSVNGWSDSLMNAIYRPIARSRKQLINRHSMDEKK
jgi:hypothetical protein